MTWTASSSLVGACSADGYCVVRYASGRDGHHANVPGRSGHFEEPCGLHRSSPCYTYALTGLCAGRIAQSDVLLPEHAWLQACLCTYPQQSRHVTIPHTVMTYILYSHARRSEVDCLHAITQVSLIFANVGVHDVLIQAELDALEAAHPGRFKACLPCLPSCLAVTDVQLNMRELLLRALLSSILLEWTV